MTLLLGVADSLTLIPAIVAGGVTLGVVLWEPDHHDDRTLARWRNACAGMSRANRRVQHTRRQHPRTDGSVATREGERGDK